MRRASRTDANQAEIAKALREHGCSVLSIATIGDGCPDLLCGYQGRNYLLEVKDGSKPPSRRKVNDNQVEWHRTWRGQVAVVRCAGAALEAVGVKEWHP